MSKGLLLLQLGVVWKRGDISFHITAEGCWNRLFNTISNWQEHDSSCLSLLNDKKASVFAAQGACAHGNMKLLYNWKHYNIAWCKQNLLHVWHHWLFNRHLMSLTSSTTLCSCKILEILYTYMCQEIIQEDFHTFGKLTKCDAWYHYTLFFSVNEKAPSPKFALQEFWIINLFKSLFFHLRLVTVDSSWL